MHRRGRRSGNTEWVFILSVLFAPMFLWGTAAGGVDASEPCTVEGVLASVRDCMAGYAPPWPESWQREYLDTIRQAAVSDPNVCQYTRRLQILRHGFALYWPTLKNHEDRFQFEVRLAEIRWYVENLMDTELRGEEEVHTLCYQYEDLANYAATSLMAQFPFLDPSEVQKAKTNHLLECHRNIDNPLLPIVMAPFSLSQMDQIKRRWHDLRYARVDLWRQMGGAPRSAGNHEEEGLTPRKYDYLLLQRSVSQLWPYIWVYIPSPDYYTTAVTAELNEQRRRLSAVFLARMEESRLDNAVLDTECISFLLTALLETPACFDQEDVREIGQLEHLDSPCEGGDADDIEYAFPSE
jgi:hypothetical protein